MIQGRVKNNVAIWRCSECGAEQPILQYILVPKYGEHIDMEDTINKRDAFIAQHTLCKKQVTQTELALKM